MIHHQTPVIFLLLISLSALTHTILLEEVTNTEWWGYANVRPHAYMFYWMYEHLEPTKKPLILWLQGGPGASSVGFGNFMEIGPLDIDLNPRKYTWLSEASLLFVDNPVGTGFSYVTSDDAYTTDVNTIASDLVKMLKKVLKEESTFQNIPLYIFSESYGGKMAAVFSLELWKTIQNGDIKCNFKGLAMGDSWIDPSGIVLSWAPFLYAMSFVDESGRNQVDAAAQKTASLVKNGQYAEATSMWGTTETIVGKLTGGVNWYNVLEWTPNKMDISIVPDMSAPPHIRELYMSFVGPLQLSKLSSLMNKQIRKKIGIIPNNVTWGGQSAKVFSKQSVEFMKPETMIVNELIEKTKLDIVVYSGQLDLIVATLGTEKWIKDLDISKSYETCKRTILIDPIKDIPTGYLKKFRNFSFYWMLNAGHMIPSDNPTGALYMLKNILGS